MSMISLSAGGGGGGSGEETPTQNMSSVFGYGKKVGILNGLFSFLSSNFMQLGTTTPEDQEVVRLIYGESINGFINNTRDARNIYDSSSGDTTYFYPSYGAAGTGAFSHTWRVSSPMPLQKNLKLQNAVLRLANVRASGNSTYEYMTDPAIEVSMKILHSDGTYTTIGTDNITISGAVTSSNVYATKKEMLFNAGSQYSTVEGDYLILEFRFFGVLTVNTNSTNYSSFVISNYRKSTDSANVPLLEFDI